MRTFPLPLLLLACCCCVDVHANGSRLPSQDARAIARGYADVAGISSAASLYYNPAGLADVTKGEIAAGTYVIVPENSFQPANGGPEVKEQSDRFVQPHVFAALPIRRDLVVGLGLFSPFGQSTDWPLNSGFAGMATFNEIRYATVSVGLGYHVTPDLSIGATVQYSRASLDLSRLTAIAPGVVTSFRFKGHDFAPSASVGAKWRAAPQHTLGVMYQRKTDFRFAGDASLTGVMTTPGQAGWVFPDNLCLGWQWDFAAGWQSEVSYDVTFWNKLGTAYLDAGPLRTAVPLNWQRSAYWNAGVSRKVSGNLEVSAGYSYSENSIPDASFTPALPDMNRHLLNAGVFWRGRIVECGLVLQRGISPSRTVSGPRPDGLGGSAAGTYRGRLWAGDATVTLRF